MLTEQQKMKFFKTCIQDVRSGDDRNIYNHELEEILKSNRDSILKLFDEDIMNVIDEKEGFRAELLQLFDLIKAIYIDTVLKPAEEDAYQNHQQTQILLENLKTDITEGFIDFDRVNRSHGSNEWGGAGVIITTDPERPLTEHHVFIVTELAPAISWVMERLRDICHPDYVEIALKVKKYLTGTEKSKISMKELALRMADSALEGIQPSQRLTLFEAELDIKEINKEESGDE